jgi:hypothetical protein
MWWPLSIDPPPRRSVVQSTQLARGSPNSSSRSSRLDQGIRIGQVIRRDPAGQLRTRGYHAVGVNLSELLEAGGSVKCCTLEIRG